jgi:hypothetical protein
MSFLTKSIVTQAEARAEITGAGDPFFFSGAIGARAAIGATSSTFGRVRIGVAAREPSAGMESGKGLRAGDMRPIGARTHRGEVHLADMGSSVKEKRPIGARPGARERRTAGKGILVTCSSGAMPRVGEVWRLGAGARESTLSEKARTRRAGRHRARKKGPP